MRFVLLAEHLKLLRNGNVTWNPDQCGAPGLDTKRPCGNGDHLADIARILGWPRADEDGNYPEGQVERMGRLHRELEVALSIVLQGVAYAGAYERDGRGEWRRVS